MDKSKLTFPENPKTMNDLLEKARQCYYDGEVSYAGGHLIEVGTLVHQAMEEGCHIALTLSPAAFQEQTEDSPQISENVTKTSDSQIVALCTMTYDRPSQDPGFIIQVLPFKGYISIAWRESAEISKPAFFGPQEILDMRRVAPSSDN